MSLFVFPSDSILQDASRERNHAGSTFVSYLSGLSIPIAAVALRAERIAHGCHPSPLARTIIVLPLLLILLLAGGSQSAMAAAPTVSLAVSGPQIGTIYFAGDSYTLTIHGPANQPVTVSQTRQSLLMPAVAWQTDKNGNFSVPGAWTTADLGIYSQTWYVGGAQASPVLSFQIAALPTVSLTVTGPQSGTTYYAGDSYTLTVTGPPNQPVTVSQTRTALAPNVTWQTNAQGVWSTTGTWTSSDVGTYTQTWYVGGVPATPGLSFRIASLPLPTISGISPASATTGTSVTISGSGFGAVQGSSTVSFNGTLAVPSSWIGGVIVVPVPEGATSGNVVVTVAGVGPSLGSFFTVQLACRSMAFSAYQVAPGTTVSPTFRASGATSVSFAVTGAVTNAYSTQIPASQDPTSKQWTANIPTSALLGWYLVTPLISNGQATLSCTQSADVFDVAAAVPSLPAKTTCSSMTGSWTDSAVGQQDLTWRLSDSSGTVSGTVASVDPCGAPVTWQAAGSYTATQQKYSLTGTQAANTSCGGGWVPRDQIVTGTVNTTGLCGLASGTFIARSPLGLPDVTGSNALAVAERIPDGESVTFAGWEAQYGYPSSAIFNMKLLSPSNLYVFGGRTVTEVIPTAAETPSSYIGADGCWWSSAPFAKAVSLEQQISWNVQSDNSYGPDSLDIGGARLYYYQTYSPALTAPGTSCTIQYPQKMVINAETKSGTEPYGGQQAGFNLLKFVITKTDITVSRATATGKESFHF